MISGKYWRRALRWSGSALAIAAIVFVSIRFHNYSQQIDYARINITVGAVILSCAIIYAIDNVLLAVAWRILLMRFQIIVSIRWAIKIYGISQLAKYVPGNVFQFAGRQALGMANGASGKALAKSVLWELGLLVLAGVTYSGLVLPFLNITLPVMYGFGVSIVTSIIIYMLISRFDQTGAIAYIYYLIFLGISGMLFIALAAVISTKIPMQFGLWLSLCAAYVVAWLVGLVTPGAPAGVGVRELVLLFLLHGLIDEADLLLAVVLGRVVTVAGDVLFFLCALTVRDGEPIKE